MKQRIYIDTSVIGGCYDQEFDEWSNALLEEFRTGVKVEVVSDLTRLELEDAPQDVREILSLIPITHVEDVFLGEEAIALTDTKGGCL